MQFTDLIQLQVLKRKETFPARTLDDILNRTEDPDIKQLCAKVHVSLVKDLDEVCSLLDMTKRQFIEAALVDALARAHHAIDSSGILDEMAPKQGSL